MMKKYSHSKILQVATLFIGFKKSKVFFNDLNSSPLSKLLQNHLQTSA